MVYLKPFISSASDDALHITGINYKGKFFRFVLEFSASYSTLPRAVKSKPPDSLIEIYG